MDGRGVRDVLGASPVHPCPLQVGTFFLFAAKHFFAHQLLSQNAGVGVKVLTQMLCKYHFYFLAPFYNF